MRRGFVVRFASSSSSSSSVVRKKTRTKRLPSKSQLQVDGRRVNPELYEGATSLDEVLDTEHQNIDESEYMQGLVKVEETIDLSEDEQAAKTEEEKHFGRFFGQREEMYDEDDVLEQQRAVEEELRRKLGAASTSSKEQQEIVREREELEEMKSRRGTAKGFEKRGRRPDLEMSAEEAAKRERERQTRVHIDGDDRLLVGDVVIPGHLEKWVLDPTGDHKSRYREQRLKEERMAEYHKAHGMYAKRKLQSTFRKDPVELDLTVRQRRIGVLLKLAVEKVLQEEFEHDPPPPVVIEDVVIARDMKSAKVFWFSPEEGREGAAVSYFQRTNSAVRYAVTQRVKLRWSPSLEFVKSSRDKREQEINEFLDTFELEKQTKQAQQQQ